MAFYKNRKHRLGVERGFGVSRAYEIWVGVRRRCRNADPNRGDACYAGISFCNRWDDFELFLEDMGTPPEGMSIDRIDPTGNYEPSNCRWADSTTQSRNRLYCRLNLDKAKEIRNRYAIEKISQQKLAVIYGCTQHLISKVVRNEIWVV